MVTLSGSGSKAKLGLFVCDGNGSIDCKIAALPPEIPCNRTLLELFDEQVLMRRDSDS
jgi:hypothetical protein